MTTRGAEKRTRAGFFACFDGGMPLVPVLAFLAIGGFVTFFFVLVKRHAQAVRDKMHALAQNMGLRVVERTVAGFTSVEALEGELNGRLVRFWTYSTGSGKSRVTWVAVGVRPRQNGGLEFELSRQGFGSKIAEWFGSKEVKVGDPQFDAAWFIQTNQPDFFAAALVPDIRAKFVNDPKVGRVGTYQLKEGMVRYVQRGQFGNEKIVRQLEVELPVLQDLADVAEVFASTKA